VYIAAHYPVDVAAGLVLGAVVALACHALGRRLVARGVVAVSSTRLRPLLTPQPVPSTQR
jgi:membrane-associated phospholipid phosphatase